MKVPEEIKVAPNMAVVFKKHFEFGGVKANAIVQREDGTMVFFDTDHFELNGAVKIPYYGEGDNDGQNQ